MFWQEELETISREELGVLQSDLLKATVARGSISPHYKKVFEASGIDPAGFRGLSDLQKLPFTVKQDLRDSFPFGFLAVDPSEVVRVHTSSGTTGSITSVLYSQKDVDQWASLMARCMVMTGMARHDVFQNLSGYGLFTGGLGFHYGAEILGAMVIPSGTGNSQRQVELMRSFFTTVIHLIPSYAFRLFEVMEEMGVDPRKDLKLRVAYLGAEPHSEETRAKVEDLFGVAGYNSYGLSEMNGPGVAFECVHQNGLHIWEDAYLLEVLDPETQEPVPEGEVGEMVLTTLKREAMPLIRYRTGDLCSILPAGCPCGRTHRRISRIAGRTDDMLIIKGVNIYPLDIEKVIMSIPEVGGNYVIELFNQKGADNIRVKVELNPGAFREDMRHLEALRQKIAKELRDSVLITPKVELVQPGKLPRSPGKAVRVVDLRGQ